MTAPATFGARRAPPAVRATIVVTMLYGFLVGVSMLETGISGLGLFLVIPLIGIFLIP